MSTEAVARPPRAKPAVGAKIVVAGLSVAAGVGLVGAMAATSRPDPTPEVRRVVVVDSSSGTAVPVSVQELPAAPAADARPGPATESGGS